MNMKFVLSLAKLTRYWSRKHPDLKFFYLRDHLRKWCPVEEILVNTKEGFKIFASPHDYVSYQIVFLDFYDKWLTSFMKAHIYEGCVCLDIGTERGWFTLLMANMVGRKGRVDAFEAFPPTYKKLENNIALNNFHWINAYNLAVCDRSGAMHFVPPSDTISSQADNGGVGHLTDKLVPNSIKVPTISIDEYAEHHPFERLDIIKIDIEGAEYAALIGAEQVIRKFRPKLVIEYNRECAKRAQTSIEELDHLLNSYGYDRYTFYGCLKKLHLDHWKDRPDNETVFNVYCFPKT